MPSFAYSRADLVVAGILSIDEMRDYLAPVGLVSKLSMYHTIFKEYVFTRFLW